MKKIIALIQFIIIFYNCSGQNNYELIAKNYDSLKNNSLYDHNNAIGKYYNIRGFKMYCEIYGEGEPLLMIHGNGDNMSAFVKQIPYFSKMYKVILADSRAQGRSSDEKNDSLSYEMMADDYASLLTELKIDSANVIGWSDGGINGLLLALRHPEKVKKLITTGLNLQPDTTVIQPEIVRRVNRTYTMLKNKENKNALDKTVYKFFKLLIEQPHIPLEKLHDLTIPTLIIGGDHDVQKVSHIIEIFQNIPKAYLWILPNSGHSTLVVYAQEFNEKVADFLKSPYRIIYDRARYF